jgi:thiosulfate reductase cytochrome b subunit
MNVREVMVYTRFERFWHWTQVVLIFALLFTGFRIHGFYSLIDFQTAVTFHAIAALGLVLLWIFTIFWHLTTGTWRHYVPSTDGLWRVAQFYAFGIFKGEKHPYRKAYWRKHNPLQAMTYLALKVILFPVIWVSGIAYFLYFLWDNVGGSGELLSYVAQIHTAVAFATLAFIIIHIYLFTTGHSFVEHVKPMVTGFDEVDLTPEEEAYLEQDEPSHIR